VGVLELHHALSISPEGLSYSFLQIVTQGFSLDSSRLIFDATP